MGGQGGTLTSNRYTIPPSRGLILDRHGELMVGSKATHDLTVPPSAPQTVGGVVARCSPVVRHDGRGTRGRS